MQRKYFLKILIVAFCLVKRVYAECPKEDSLTSQISANAIVGFAMSYATYDLAPRCAEIIGCQSWLDALACASYMGKLVTAADTSLATFSQGEREYLSSDLFQVGQDPRTLEYLKQLEIRLKNPKKFNLWAFTERAVGMDKKFALKVMATIFQDRSYKTNKLTAKMDKLRKSILKGVLKRMREGKLKAYPAGVSPNKTGLYHFYSIGYMALKMNENGVPKKYAATLPFILNERYETIFNRSKNKKAFEDIFTAYAGVNFALEKEKHYKKGERKPLSRYRGVRYDQFSELYYKDKEGSLNTFFKEDMSSSFNCDGGAVPYKESLDFSTLQRLSLPQRVQLK
jgi:hypothetical protein